MGKMELKEGTRVFASDGKEVGRIRRFVINPATNEVTHIVVQKGWLISEDRVVPFEMVNTATEHMVVLSENMHTFKQLPPFEETHYSAAPDADVSRGGSPRHTVEKPERSEEPHHDQTVEADVSHGGAPRYGAVPSYYSYPPRRYVGYPLMELTRNIPEHTIPLREGTDVISFDGEHIGDLERLFVAADSNRATHFVISQGLLFKDRKLIPAHWVRTVDEDKVELAVSSKRLEDLPAYEPQ